VVTDLDEQRERARAAREELVGKTIAGRYVLRGLVGHGGMGAVYEAEHLGLGKRVAIKFVDPEFATDDKVVARFAREARAMSAIESAHIVTVFDAGTEDGRPYLVMELLRGEDLGQRLRRTQRVPVPEAMHLVAQVLKGLARAHAAGIVHRDLKPDNVFVLKHDTDPLFAKIVDFGVSKIERPRSTTSPLALTGRGTVLGTPFYMSPEQAQASSDVDGRADLYSVGAILFECLTGRPPHTGESYEQVILSICMREAPSVRVFNPSVSAEVAAFVARSLVRDRSLRFASAERMLAALHEVAPEERARVPLDPAAATLMSPGGAVPEVTVLDSGSKGRGVRPSDEPSVATRFGVATLSAGSGAKAEGTPEDAKPVAAEVRATRPEPAARAGARGSAAAEAGDTPAAREGRADEPAARAGSRDKPAARDGRGDEAGARGARASAGKKPAAPRPIGVAVITAALATLTGVGATFLVIALLEKKGPPDPPRATSSALAPWSAAAPASAAASAPPPTVFVPAPPSASAPAPPSVPAAASGSSSSGGSGKLGGTAPSRSPGAGTAIPPLPRPTSTKPLDINRDLP
jgi:serine/threonine-protein kinase